MRTIRKRTTTTSLNKIGRIKNRIRRMGRIKKMGAGQTNLESKIKTS
jgi:hypothetical protein